MHCEKWRGKHGEPEPANLHCSIYHECDINMFQKGSCSNKNNEYYNMLKTDKFTMVYLSILAHIVQELPIFIQPIQSRWFTVH